MKKEERKCFIQFLLICSPQQFDFILKSLTKDQLQIIMEILFNVIKGVCPISDKNKTVLMKRKRFIRAVLLSKLTLSQRKQGLRKIQKILPIFLKACMQYGS